MLERLRIRPGPVLLLLTLVAVLGLSPALLAADAAGHGGEMTMAEKAQHALKTTGWALLAFGLVLLILWKKLFPPIIQALDERARKIQEALDAAKKAQEEAAAMMAQNEASLEKARAEGQAIIEEAREDAVKVKNSIIEDARGEAEAITQRGLRELEQAKHTAVDELYRQASSLSLDLAEKVIQKSLTPEDHKSLIDQTIQTYRERI